jgi:hypothetical protein
MRFVDQRFEEVNNEFEMVLGRVRLRALDTVMVSRSV